MPERFRKRKRKQRIPVMTQGKVFPSHMVQVQRTPLEEGCSFICMHMTTFQSQTYKVLQ